MWHDKLFGMLDLNFLGLFSQWANRPQKWYARSGVQKGRMLSRKWFAVFCFCRCGVKWTVRGLAGYMEFQHNKGGDQDLSGKLPLKG